MIESIQATLAFEPQRRSDIAFDMNAPLRVLPKHEIHVDRRIASLSVDRLCRNPIQTYQIETAFNTPLMRSKSTKIDTVYQRSGRAHGAR
jgi:hypothetical protein